MVITSPTRGAALIHAPDAPTGHEVHAIVAKTGIFRMVEPSEVAHLTEQVDVVRFSARQDIYREYEPGDQVYVIAAGKVKIGRRRADGQRHLLAVIGSSDMFGELGVFDPGPRTSSATAVTDVVAVTMHRDVLQAWLASHPEMAERLLRVLARRLRRIDNDRCDLVFTDVAGRVAKKLLRLAQRFGVQENGALRVDHGLTQDELAQLVGATRETVNKVLIDFTRRGWIVAHGKSVLIIDSEHLLRRAS